MGKNRICLRGLVHVRAILGNLKVLVLPDQLAIKSASKAFDEDGNLVEEKDQVAIAGLGAKLAAITSKLKTTS